MEEAKAPSNILVFFLVCIFFSPLMVVSQIDTPPGEFPFVNPTTPGTAPIVNPVNPPPTTTTSPAASSGGAWCIASSSASDTTLQVALDYACGYGGADCSAIQPSGACYDPSTVRDHASYAFNDYYQKNPAPTSCVFGGAAQLTYTDPSSGSCRFASSTNGILTSPPMTNPPPMTNLPPTLPMPPPSTTTPPINPYPPIPPVGNGYGSDPTPPVGNGYGSDPTLPTPPVGNGYGSDPNQPTGGNDYGSDPTGPSSSSAQTLPINLLLFVTMSYLILG